MSRSEERRQLKGSGLRIGLTAVLAAVLLGVAFIAGAWVGGSQGDDSAEIRKLQKRVDSVEFDVLHVDTGPALDDQTELELRDLPSRMDDLENRLSDLGG